MQRIIWNIADLTGVAPVVVVWTGSTQLIRIDPNVITGTSGLGSMLEVRGTIINRTRIELGKSWPEARADCRPGPA